jgi:hypothetical protein
MSVQSVVLGLTRVFGHEVYPLTDWAQLISFKDGIDLEERLLLLNRVVLFQFGAVRTFIVGRSVGYSRRRGQQGTQCLGTAQGKIVMDDKKAQLIEPLLTNRQWIAGVLVEYECPALKPHG